MNDAKKILICDSDNLRARSLAMAFSDASPDWVIGIVHRGKDGINMIQENPQDCILLQEIDLPDIEGLIMFKEIRKLDGEVPVILLSSKPHLESALEAIHLGVFDYLKEPYSISQVLSVVQKAFNKTERKMEMASLLQDTEEEEVKHFNEDAKKIEEDSEEDFVLEPPNKTDHLLSKCLVLSMDLLQATKGMALQVDRDSNRLVVKESIGFEDEFLKHSSYDMQKHDDFRKVVTQGKPCIVQTEEGRIACAPLGNAPHVFGMIGLSRPWSFTDTELNVLSVFAPLAPYSLEGARVHTELEAVRAGSIRSFLVLLEAKEPELLQHTMRVMDRSKILADSVGLPETTIGSIKFAALLHEVGTLAESNSSRTEEHRGPTKHFRRSNGSQKMTDRIIEPLRIPEEAKRILHHKCERYDGKGTPDGLKGEEIPIGARILAIVDAYDEGISDGITEKEVLEGLYAFAGTQFDPFLVNTLFSKPNEEEKVEEEVVVVVEEEEEEEADFEFESETPSEDSIYPSC